MTTFAELKTAVSRDLRDPDGKVFDSTVIGDLINVALVEVGIVAPAKFQQDVDLVENQFEYTLRQDLFSSAVPEIEVYRVELWDTTATPSRPVSVLTPAAQGYINASNTGWYLRDGIIEIDYNTVAALGSTVDNYLLRVWGYSPYLALSSDSDVSPLSTEREYALRAYCRVESLMRLVAERDLFTQWQTHPGNTDVTPASLMNALASAQDDWRRRARRIMVLRETAG